MASHPHPESTAAVANPGSRHNARRGAFRVLRLFAIRLRFPLIIILAFVLVTQWDHLRAWSDLLIRLASGRSAARGTVVSDNEFFCPMDPGVLSDWPGKCPICNMALVRRKRGEMTPLPDGVLARVQLSPYRIQLGGIRSTPARYRPLAAEIRFAGTIARTSSGAVGVEGNVARADADILEIGLPVVVAADGLARREPLRGKVERVERQPDDTLTRVFVRLADSADDARAGLPVTATIRIPIADREPFRSLPSDPPALASGEARVFFRCPEHSESIALESGKCPIDHQALARHALSANQRIRWWCPMHPEVTAEKKGSKCASCSGMPLVARVITYRPKGEVLAIPESAVVDTGTKRVVFVEKMSGVFEAIEVELGQSCGAEYPVVRGLEADQRVVIAGAFALDAETRLNPSLAASYFGASRSAQRTNAPANDTQPQKYGGQTTCPVTGKRLGSMGEPILETVQGRGVWLCCEGCRERLRSSAAKYLSKLPPASAHHQ